MVLEGSLPNHTLVAPFSVVGKALHITSSEVIYKSIKVLNDSMWSKGSLEPSRTLIREDETLVGVDSSTLPWWMVNPSFESFRPSSPWLYLLPHSWVHPSPSLCCKACFPFWTSFPLAFLSSCSSGYPILPHYGFLWSSDALLHSGFPWSAIIPHSRIQQLFSALHSGESLLPS